MNIYKKIARNFGVSLIIAGLNTIKNLYKGLKPVVLRSGDIKEAMNKITNIIVGFYDKQYYTTNKDNWNEMLDVISAIIKVFEWIKEKFDCDNRARLVSSLCSLLFGLNTCGYVYCETTHINTGKKSLHYANLVVLDDGSLILYDVDNKRRKLVLDIGKPITMGYKTYKLLKAYFG